MGLSAGRAGWKTTPWHDCQEHFLVQINGADHYYYKRVLGNLGILNVSLTTERNVRGDGAAVAWVYHHTTITTITTELCLSPEGGVGVRTGRGMSRLLPGERLMLLLLRVEGRVVVLWRLGLLDVRQDEG